MVEREELKQRYIQHEQAKAAPDTNPVTTLAHTVAPQSKKKKIAPAKRWVHEVRRDRVARRIYQGVPDFVCLSSDWFGSWMLDRSDRDQGAQALFYLGFLVRYGYWTSAPEEPFLKPHHNASELCGLANITAEQHTRYIDWLVRAGLLIHRGLENYALNPEIVRLANNPHV